MVGLRPDPSVILPQLLSGILSTRGPQQHLERVKTGMAESQLNFSNSMLLGTPLVFPPDLSEQRHVAAILDTVDEAIRQTEAVVEKLKKIKQGLLHDLLTRGIGKDGKLRPPPAQAPHLYKGSPLGKIPNEWEVKEIKRMSTLITKGTTPTTYGFDYAKEGVAFLRVENISNEGSIDVQGCLHITVACQEFMRRSQLKEADVLISIAGTIGRSACVPATTLPANINQALAIVRCEESQLLPPFLSYYLSSQLGRSAMLGQTVQLAQANLSLTEVGRTLVAMPATPEQRSIVSALQAHGERTDADSKTCEKLKLIKQGLKEDLLTGRVRVTDLPKDIEKMLDEIAGRN
jgi:type I restriction enzyme S subunit